MTANKMNKAKTYPDEISAILDDHFQKLTEDQRVVSALAGVEALDGSFRWVGAHGSANLEGEPIQPDTPIWIASVTKLYIAAAILKLAEQGLIEIEAQMAEYLSYERIKGLHHMSDGVDRTGEITIRNLLSHSSGLPDFLEECPEGERGLMDQVFDGNDRFFSVDEGLDLVRNHLPSHFPPQPRDSKKKKIRYSDTNFQLLMEIIKAVTDQTLPEAFTKLIYEPLGLEATFHPGMRSEQVTEEAALVWVEDQALDIPQAMRSFRDLGSTLEDMTTFMRGLIQGKVFDNPETWRMMHDEFNTFEFSLNLRATSPGWPIEYGLGLMRFEMPRIFTPFNPIPAVIGHTGVSGSWLFFCPEYDLILTGTVNQVVAAALPFRFIPRLLGDRRWLPLFEG